MATICITGGTGLVGTALSKYLLSKGHTVIILSRNSRESNHPQLRYARWDVATGSYDTHAFSETDYVIHLAGAGVADKRWTAARKKEILESRTQSSGLLVKALSETSHHIKAVISASAIGWYGADKGIVFREEAPADTAFLGETCRLWEESVAPVSGMGIRLVTLRIGIVLSNEGGAFSEFKKPLRFGIAPILGNGEQMISWIHMADLCRMFEFATEKTEMSGAYNATAPDPVTNRDLMIQLANTLRNRFYIPVPVPAFILKLLLGEMSIEVLKSCTASSEKISAAGFRFSYPSLKAALNELCSNQSA
jgi:uncharacterized protein (TIGR01777 family)